MKMLDEGQLYRGILTSIQDNPELTRKILEDFRSTALQDMITRCLEIVGLCQKIQVERLNNIMTLKCPKCEHNDIVGVHKRPGDKMLSPLSPVWVMCKACYHLWTMDRNRKKPA